MYRTSVFNISALQLLYNPVKVIFLSYNTESASSFKMVGCGVANSYKSLRSNMTSVSMLLPWPIL